MVTELHFVSLFARYVKAESALGTECLTSRCAVRGEGKDGLPVSLPANCSVLFWLSR